MTTRKISVLLADDEDHIRVYMARVLESMSCEIVADAADGRECIELYRQHLPDVTLLDINMPFMSGIEALKAIRGEFPDAFVIMLTSLHTSRVVEECLQAGAAHYIRKDAPLNDIKRQIKEAWGARIGWRTA
jgi:DNA-binding NarL/FixJ family response regulator